jgi:chromosome segregation ATPase
LHRRTELEAAIESLVGEHERAVNEYQQRVGALTVDLNTAKQESANIKVQMQSLQSELKERELELDEEKIRSSQLSDSIAKTQKELLATQEGNALLSNGKLIFF